MEHTIQQDTHKQLAANAGAKLVQNGMVIGLGTGSTATYFIYALAQRIHEGLHILGAVASSHASYALAQQLGIPMTDLDTYPELDLYVDGADEIAPHLQLLKGAGGALLREKIVASSSQRFVVIADASKEVTHLGQRFPVPVETLPFAATPVRKRLERVGAHVEIRQHAGTTFVTENGNIILDCRFPEGISHPAELDAQLHAIVGVLETGLFLTMAHEALIASSEGVRIVLP